jgi:hypothetical protein
MTQKNSLINLDVKSTGASPIFIMQVDPKKKKETQKQAYTTLPLN